MAGVPIALVSFGVLVPIIAVIITAGFTWAATSRQYRSEANDKATQALQRYRDPLLRASFDLQSRLYNLGARRFLARYWKDGDEDQRFYARWSTLWLFGQFLGWVEILRRQVQYLDLGSAAENRRLQWRLNAISAAIASDSSGQNDLFIIYRSDQRAIGESMVVARPGQVEGGLDCMGYSEFIGAFAMHADGLEPDSPIPDSTKILLAWADRFTADLDKLERRFEEQGLPTRIVKIQRVLIDLIDLLDADQLRYPHRDYRGRLPEERSAPRTTPARLARFIWPWSDPWPEIETWANDRGMSPADGEGERSRAYCGSRWLLGRRLETRFTYAGEWLSIDAGTVRWKRSRQVGSSLRDRRARKKVNGLLRAFDRPELRDGGTAPDRFVELVLRLARHLLPSAADRGS